MTVKYKRIVCIGDMMHHRNIVFRYAYDLIAEPIRQATGIEIERFLDVGLDGESVDARFKRALGEATPENWSSRCFHRVPEPARRLFLDSIPDDCLVVAFEIPPWMARACSANNIPWVDLKFSPLRFCSDMFMAMKSSESTLNQHLDQWAVRDDRVRLEAGQLKARLRMHDERMKIEGLVLEDLAGACIYVGQTPQDAALIAEDGHFVRCEEFAEALRAETDGKKVFYKAHPYASAFAAEERKVLERIIGRPVSLCFSNAYQMLCCHRDVTLIGLSSGLMQEAAYFGARGLPLFRFYCPLGPQASENVSVNIEYQDFVSVEFWAHLLGSSSFVRRSGSTIPHAMRDNFGAWWDYGKVLTWNNGLYIEAFERSGGKVLRDRVERLEAAVYSQPQRGAPTAHAETEVLVFLKDKLSVGSVLDIVSETPDLAAVCAALGLEYQCVPGSMEGHAGSGAESFDLGWCVSLLEGLSCEEAGKRLQSFANCRYLLCIPPKGEEACVAMFSAQGWFHEEFLTRAIRAKSATRGGRLAADGMILRRRPDLN